MKATHFGLLFIIMCFLSGCAVVESTRIESNKSSTDGTVYYLPTKLLKLEFVRAVAPTKPELDKAKAAFQAATDARDTAKKVLDVAEQRRKKIDAPDVASISEADKVVGLAKADLKIAEEELTKSSAKVETTQADYLQSLEGKSPLADTVTVTVLPSIADTKYRYSANLDHLPSRSDKLDLKTTTSGLLSNSTAKTEDQTAQIIVSIAQSLAAFGIGVLPMPLATNTVKYFSKEPLPAAPPDIYCGNNIRRAANEAPKPFKFEYVFDPTASKVSQQIRKNNGKLEETNLAPWEYVESSLCSLGADYSFNWKAVGTEIKSTDVPEKGEGLFYRRLLPYTLTINTGKRGSVTEAVTAYGADKVKPVWSELHHLKTMQFEVPNASPPELMKIEGSIFATREFSSEFQEGILVSHNETKPGELLSFFTIPYNIAKTFASIATEFVSLKVNYNNAKASEIESNTKITLDEKATIEAQRTYQETLNASKNASTTQ